MIEKEFYYTIEKPGIAEFRDRGSKFIAYAFPLSGVGDFKLKMEQVKKEHPKATHHCYAYRLGFDKNNFRVNDDGEPSGTAGRPILRQIDSKELTDIVIIVARYFGGSLLGVPGLINAYKTSASMAIQVVPYIQKPIEVRYGLQFDYTVVNTVMSIIKQFSCTIFQQEMQLFCRFVIGVGVSREKDFVERIREMHTVELIKQ